MIRINYVLSPFVPSVLSEKARRAERRSRAKEDHKDVISIHQDEEEEAQTGRMAGAPLDRAVALITANEGDKGGRQVYREDEGDMEKGYSAANAAAAYIAIVGGGGVVADQSKDATAEEFPDPQRDSPSTTRVATVMAATERTIAR